MASGINDLSFASRTCILAFPLCVCSMIIVINKLNCHVFPFVTIHIQFFLVLMVERWLLITIAQVNSLFNLLLKANLATDNIDMVHLRQDVLPNILKDGLFNHHITTMPIQFLRHLKAAIDLLLNSSAVNLMNWQIIFKDVVQVFQDQVICDDKCNLALPVFSLHCKRVFLSFVFIASNEDCTVLFLQPGLHRWDFKILLCFSKM